MNTTYTKRQEAIDAADAAVAAAGQAVVDAVELETSTAAKLREAGNAYELAKQGAFLIPADQRHELAAAERAFEAALEAHETAKRGIQVAEAEARAAEKRADAARAALYAPEAPTHEEMDADLRDALAEFEAAGEARHKAEAALQEIEDALRDLDAQHAATLAGRHAIDRLAGALSGINAKREILHARKPAALEKLAAATALQAEKLRTLQGFLNPKVGEIVREVQTEIAAFRSGIDKFPVARLAGALITARDMVGHAGTTGHSITMGQEFLATFEALEAPIREQLVALKDLGAVVKARLLAAEAAVNEALGDGKGGVA